MEEYISGTLQELSVAYAKKQPHQVNHLLEETTILNTIKFQPSSHDLWNAYEEVTGIKTAEMVKMDAPLPTMGVDSALKKVDLDIMGGKMFIGEDKAQMYGGASKYFADRMPALLRTAGMATERNLIYKNIKPYAIANEQVVSAGATGNNTYSMFAVRQIPSEICGLYSPKGFANGAMLEAKAINGGNIYENEDGILGFGVRLKGYFGFQLANKEAVAGIVNITKSQLPTAEQIDAMLVAVRANPSTTKIWCHPALFSIIAAKYKSDIMKTVVGDRDLNRTLTHWNGIEIITSYNFDNGTEAATTL